MNEQRKMEIIKALAYGESPEQAAAAEGIDVLTVQEIQRDCAAEVAEERETLKKAGGLHD